MTPEALARMLVATYGLKRREEIVEAIQREYPDADTDTLIADAVRWIAERDAATDEQLEEEDARARRAEHDLSKSTHKEV